VAAFLDSTAALRDAFVDVKWVAIGPTTAGALSSMGLSVAAVAPRPTAEGLVEATVQALATR